MELVSESRNLISSQPGGGKHSNLSLSMRPILPHVLLQPLPELTSHPPDPCAHRVQIRYPLSSQIPIPKNRFNNICPKTGGLEYSTRAIAISSPRAPCADRCRGITRCKAPTRSLYSPKFFENNCATHRPGCVSRSRIFSTKCRTAYASPSTSPVAKPWYALSKTPNSFF